MPSIAYMEEKIEFEFPYLYFHHSFKKIRLFKLYTFGISGIAHDYHGPQFKLHKRDDPSTVYMNRKIGMSINIDVLDDSYKKCLLTQIC